MYTPWRVIKSNCPSADSTCARGRPSAARGCQGRAPARVRVPGRSGHSRATTHPGFGVEMVLRLSFSGFRQHSWYRSRVGPVITADEGLVDAVVSGDVNEDVAAGCLAFEDA